jgi:hypothetical protein
MKHLHPAGDGVSQSPETGFGIANGRRESGVPAAPVLWPDPSR